MLGVTCAPPLRRGAVTVCLRTSEDGVRWSRWYRVALEVASDGDKGAPVAFSEAIWTGAGRYVEVAARGARGSAAPRRLSDVKVVAINSTEDANRSAEVVGALRRTAARVAGVDTASEAVAMTTRPAIVTRAGWGANESWRDGSPCYAKVKMAFVHHTASGNGYSRSQAAAVVRGVYAYHTQALHWSDIGYNFLIDRYGTIYEGRYGGMTRGPIGAQTLGFNTGSTGISMIGTFSSVRPPAAAVTALERLLAWKLDVHHIDPQGKAALVCGYGQKYATGEHVTFRVISGHRNANYTTCPGAKLYALLPTIRSVAERRGQPKIYSVAVKGAYLSPDGDGVHDRSTLRFTVSETASWTVEIVAAGGEVVRRFNGAGTAGEVTWAGRDSEGNVLPDGAYSAVVRASSTHGDARPARATIHVDMTPPQLGGATVAPNPFSPNGDGHADRTRVRYEPGEAGAARVSVLDGSGQVVRRVTGWRETDAGAQSVAWDGRVAGDDGLTACSDGSWTILLEMRDRAGNLATALRTVVVDRTLRYGALAPRTCSPNGDGVRDSVTVGFRLIRRADVAVRVVAAGQAVRTIDAGSLAAGAYVLEWDGRLDGGEYASSGAYSLRVSARSALGATSAAEGFTADRYRPRLTAPDTVSVALGRTAKVPYTVRDAYSPSVRVTVSVTGAGGGALALVDCGWVKQGVGHICAWRPSARGTYTLTFRARDRGGNRQNAVAVTTLRVR